MAHVWFMGQSSSGLEHSKTLRAHGNHDRRASVLECGGPPPLSPLPCQTVPMLTRIAKRVDRPASGARLCRRPAAATWPPSQLCKGREPVVNRTLLRLAFNIVAPPKPPRPQLALASARPPPQIPPQQMIGKHHHIRQQHAQNLTVTHRHYRAF